MVASWTIGQAFIGPKNVMCAFGELHPKIIDAFSIKGPAVAFAIHLENPPQPKRKTATRAALKVSDLQAVERDFAFVVDTEIEALTLLNAAKGADKALILDASIFDVLMGQKQRRKWVKVKIHCNNCQIAANRSNFD